MAMYVKALVPQTFSFSSDLGAEFHLDQRVVYKVLPLWVAELVTFQEVWAAHLVQVATDTAFTAIITTIPPGELGVGTTINGISDVPGLTTALAAKADASVLSGYATTIALASKAEITDLAPYATSAALTSGLSTKADASVLSNYATTIAVAGKQPLDTDLTTFAGLAPVDNDVLQRKSGAWINRTPTQLKTDLALTKTDVSLSLVDNTPDASKPVSTAQAAADAVVLSSAATAAAAASKSADTIVDGTTNKVLSATDKTRLAGTSGTNTGDQTSVTGNAGTATRLATARNINGVAFDGTANITLAIGSRPSYYYVDDYGADPTGVADSTAAFAACRTAMGTSPGIFVVGVGTYINTVPVARFYEKQSAYGQGKNASLVNYSGSGVCFTGYDTRAAGAGGPGTGAIYGRMTIDGNSAPASSGGWQLGDMSGIRVEDLQTNNFHAANSFGAKFLNQTTWTERINATITTYNCTEGVVFDVSGGTVSFGYAELWLNTVCLANQNGVVLRNGAFIYNASGEMVGNFTGAAGSNTGTAIIIGDQGAGDPAALIHSDIRFTMESNGTSGWIAHKSIAVGSNGSCQLQGQGLLRFFSAPGVTWVAPTGLVGNHFAFSGEIVIPGYNSWALQQGLAVRGYAGYSLGFMGGSGSGIFLSTTGNYLVAQLTPGAHTYTIDSGSAAKANTGEASSWDLVFIQPASGGASTITWPAEFVWNDGHPPVLSITPSGRDHIHVFTYNFTQFFAKHVNGDAIGLSIVDKTTNYTLGADEFVKSDATSGALAHTLPTAPKHGTRVGGKKTDGTTAAPGPAVVFTAGGSDKINTTAGGTTITLSKPNQAFIAQYDGNDATWVITSTDVPLSQLLLVSNNLSDVANAATARTNLGLAIGTNVQAWDADLDTWATKTSATTATASTVAERDASANLLSDAFIPSSTSTATAAGTTTLTVDSTEVQFFTGATTQTVVLPTTGIVAGHRFAIINLSSGVLTVQSSGANTIITIPGGPNSAIFVANTTTPTTAAHWTAQAFPSQSAFTSSFATTSTIPVRNAQGNVLADVFISSLATVVTAAGTTTFTVDSVGTTVFTGATTQTVTLPTTSLVAGHTYRLINTSSGAVTINSSGGNLVKTLAASSATEVTALVATPTTAAHWFAS